MLTMSKFLYAWIGTTHFVNTSAKSIKKRLEARVYQSYSNVFVIDFELIFIQWVEQWLKLEQSYGQEHSNNVNCYLQMFSFPTLNKFIKCVFVKHKINFFAKMINNFLYNIALFLTFSSFGSVLNLFIHFQFVRDEETWSNFLSHRWNEPL